MCPVASGAVRLYTGGCAEVAPKFRGSLGEAQREGDTMARGVLLSGDALGVDPQQQSDAVPGPLGHLRRRDPCVQPGGNRRMAEIVRAARER